MVNYVFRYQFTLQEMTKSRLLDGRVPAQPAELQFTLQDKQPEDEKYIPALQRKFQEIGARLCDANVHQILDWLNRRNSESTRVLDAYTNYLRQAGNLPATESQAQRLQAFLDETLQHRDPAIFIPAYRAFIDQWGNDLITRALPDITRQMDEFFDAQEAAFTAFRTDPRGKQLKRDLHATPDYQRFAKRRRRVWLGKGAKAFMLLSITAAQGAASSVGHPAGFRAIKWVGTFWRNAPIIVALGTKCFEDLNLQAKTLVNVAGDINKVLAAFDAQRTRGSSLQKHLTAMRSEKTMRDQNLANLRRLLNDAEMVRDMRGKTVCNAPIAPAR